MDLRTRISRNPIYQGLNRRDRETVISGKNWHPDKSHTTLCEGIFGVTWGRIFCRLLSSYAHSDALSVHGLLPLRDFEAQQRSAEAMMRMVGLVLAEMSKRLAKRWVIAGRAYRNHPARDLNESLFPREP